MEIIVDSKEDTSPNYSVSFVDVSTIKQESNCEDEQEWSEIDITEEPIDANDIKEEPVEISVCKTEAPCLNIIECPVCKTTSFDRTHLKYHLSNNCVSEESKSYIDDCKNAEIHKCTMCDRVYKRKGNLDKHIFAHKNEKLFSCSHCHFKSNRRGCLNSHVISKHRIDLRTGTKIFKCKICYEEFSERTALTMHMRAVHDDKKPYQCEYCDLRYSWPESLMKHTRIHTGENLHTCQICKRVFVERRKLVQHINTHLGKGFPCSKCHYRPQSLAALNTHIERVHNS